MIDIELQVIGASLRAIAEEMGAALIRSAFSANMKERRDCSTALFDKQGSMVTQAEHIPVHLGAMPEAVAAVMAHDPAPGEPWILNDPYAGGTHLPDLTIVTRTELGYAVTRAHHADVGGSEPGSLPPGSRTLDEEGVIIPPTRLDESTLESLVSRMRNPDERRGDLRAQLAGNRIAERRVAELCARRGLNRVTLRWTSSSPTRNGSSARRFGSCRTDASRAPSARDADRPARHPCRRDRRGRRDRHRLRGTAPQYEGNLNCPLAVTRSACFYVVRCLTAPDLPASGGAFAPVTVRAPEAWLVNARAPAAVAAGNTETSSRITDVVFDAFSRAIPVPAQGQGTMNNTVLGNDRFTYYETIGGGQGACPSADGPSGVHVAMSNTFNTPAEALELAYPLRVERYELRPGSGGDGLHRGGDGVVRELRILEPCRLSLLSQRRALPPQGARGGENGLSGQNFLNGEELPAIANLDLTRRPPPDRDSRGRRVGEPALEAKEREPVVRVDDREVELELRAQRVDDDVLGAVVARDREVARSEEASRVACALVRPVLLGVGDVAGRSDRDVDGREGSEAEARLRIGVDDRARRRPRHEPRRPAPAKASRSRAGRAGSSRAVRRRRPG